MRYSLLLLFIFISLHGLQAQRIRVNGDVKTRKEVPIQGVLIMAFDRGTMIKSYISDEKGEYSFNVDRMVFDILFYKPGMRSHSYSLNNKLNKETQGVYVYIQMDDSTAETAVNLTLWLNQHHIASTYIDSVYTEEIRKLPPPQEKHKSKKQLMKEALAEQKRFSNYKESTVKRSVDNHQSDVTTVLIGPDTYELITSDKGDKKYFKNKKPIAESTYHFETTRRYDGVLKNSKNVKHFDKYHPMQHVKG